MSVKPELLFVVPTPTHADCKFPNSIIRDFFFFHKAMALLVKRLLSKKREMFYISGKHYMSMLMEFFSC